mmetsp:Transcript_7139/g.22299  ORF Transcript_7139/g.22299 Transcript_7139/m.22299 type:complete len:214 (+) Transcript_7139:141-782(+)
MSTSGACFLDVTLSTLAISNSAKTAAWEELPASAHTSRPPEIDSRLMQPSQGVPAPAAAGAASLLGHRTTTAMHGQCAPDVPRSSRSRRGSTERSAVAGQLPGRSRMAGGAAADAAAAAGCAAPGVAGLPSPPTPTPATASCDSSLPERPLPAATAPAPTPAAAAFLRFDHAEAANFAPQWPPSACAAVPSAPGAAPCLEVETSGGSSLRTIS